MTHIEIRDVAKRFGDVPILDGVDLTIGRGEFVSLLGPSGCGKSTLLRIVSGLEKQSRGSVLMDGTPVDRKPPRERDFSMVFQSYALYPHLTVAENIATPLTMRRLSTVERLMPFALTAASARRRRDIADEVGAVCDTLGLGSLKARKPGALSGGQRQRVALARAMVRKPAAFLMDEPLSNLDAKMRGRARTEIALLHRSLGATFLYVTHDQAEAMTMSSRIAVMMGGRILQVDTPDKLYNDPQALAVAQFIGSPTINVVRQADGGALAFRPEAARLVPAQGAAFRGRVVHLENLGSDVFVHVETADETLLVVRVDPAAAKPILDESVGVAADRERLLAFRPDGKRQAITDAMACSLAGSLAVWPRSVA